MSVRFIGFDICKYAASKLIMKVKHSTFWADFGVTKAFGGRL